MSTGNEREALRRALQLADAIEPRGDGLQLIQTRLRPPRPLAIAWAEAVWTILRMRLPSLLQEAAEGLHGLGSLAWERFGPRSGTAGGRASRTLGWLRPAAALGVTVFIVAAGTYIAIDTQQGISPSASNAVRSTGGGRNTGNGSQGNGTGTNASQSTLGPSGSTSGTTKPACKPTRSSGGAVPSSSTPGPIQSISPSSSPTDSSGSSPSPTPSGSSAASPGATSTGQAGLSATGTDVPAVGSSSPAVATLTSRTNLARSSVASASLATCTKKHRVPRNTPGPTPAVFSYGKIDDGS